MVWFNQKHINFLMVLYYEDIPITKTIIQDGFPKLTSSQVNGIYLQWKDFDVITEGKKKNELPTIG